MTVRFNHTIVHCRDEVGSARFLADVLGVGAPKPFGHFQVVELDDGASLDKQPGEINRRDGGQSVNFLDPDGHLLEVLTRPYRSGSQ